MVYDQPNLCEIDMMIGFCERYPYIYIYGCEDKQIMLQKYLRISGIEISGFVITSRRHWETCVRGTAVYTLDEIAAMDFENDKIGFLLALPGIYYNDVLCRLQTIGFSNVFYMSEYNKNTIAYKMRPRTKEQFWLEVNLADHCNLDCQMCDHYSPLSDKWLLNPMDYQRDMERLAYLMDGTMGIMKLQGGEPLLNQRTGEIIRITRKYFPKTRIWLFTNGILLLKSEYWEEGNLWKCMHENDVEIQLTMYPIHLDYDKIQKKAEEYHVKLEIFKEAADRSDDIVEKTSVKHPHDLSGGQDLHSFISCYQFNESIVLQNGRIYTCPIIPYSCYLERVFEFKFERCKKDSIDIYGVDSFEEIAEFVTHRMPFCRYCNVRKREFGIKWRQSEHTLDEYLPG